MAVKSMSMMKVGGTDYTINDPNNAEEFSTSKAYSVGNFCYYQGNLYRFIAPHAAGAWNASDVVPVTVGSEIERVDQKIDGEISLFYKYVLPDSPVQNILPGVVDFKTGNVYTSSTLKHTSIDVSQMIGEVCAITGKTQTVSNDVWYCLYAIYDSSNNMLDRFGVSSTEYDKHEVTIPAGAKTLVVNGTSTVYPTVYMHESKAQKAYDYTVADEYNFASHLFNKEEPAYTSGGIMNFQNDTPYLTNYGKKYSISPGDVCFINGKTSTVNANVNYNLYGFYDSSMNLLSVSHFRDTDTVHEGVVAVAPVGAAYCYVNGKIDYDCKLYILTEFDIKQYIDTHVGGSAWYSKKIGVLGTSVAFGSLAETSYSYEAAQKLGYQLKMFAVPGLAIETESDGSPKEYGSFTLSKSEYEEAGITISSSPVTPYVPGGSYNDYYRTYENVFVSENADVDLWVYAVVPNNENFALDDWNAFNKNTFAYNDSSSFASHRKTFLGALLFIMNQMYTLNPNARMVFVLDSNFSYDSGLSNLMLVSEQWNIPIINLWGKINTCPPSLEKIKSESGTNNHPSTFAHQKMGSMFVGELGLVN